MRNTTSKGLSFKEKLTSIFFEEDPSTNGNSSSLVDTSYYESISEGVSTASDVAKQIIIDSQYESDNDELVDISNVEPAIDAIGENASRDQLRGIIEKIQKNNPDDMIKDGENRIRAINSAIKMQRQNCEALKVDILKTEESLRESIKQCDDKYYAEEGKTYTECDTAIDIEKKRSEDTITSERAQSSEKIEELRAQYEAAVEAERERCNAAIENERIASAENIEAIRESANNARETLKAEHQAEIDSLNQELESNSSRLGNAELIADAVEKYGNAAIAETQRWINAIK